MEFKEDKWLWNGNILQLQVDHKFGRNADNTDDELWNLQFLCPNCHDFKSRNQRHLKPGWRDINRNREFYTGWI